MKLFLFTVLAIGSATPIRSYPIPPQPLRKLYAEADLVISGTAGPTVKSKESGRSRVDLKIEKTYKGTKTAASVRIWHDPEVFCPLADTYPEGRRILAFLKRYPDGTHFAPGLSDGSKKVDDDGLKAYESRMAELATFDPERLGALPDEEVLEWLVKCAEHPATRREAIHEFDGHNSWTREISRKTTQVPVRFDRLNLRQQERLIKAFLDSKELDFPAVDLAKFLAPVKDLRIETSLRDGLTKSISSKDISLGEDLMEVLAQRLDIKEWSTLQEGMNEHKTDEFGEQSVGSANESKRLKVLEEALRLVNSKLK